MNPAIGSRSGTARIYPPLQIFSGCSVITHCPTSVTVPAALTKKADVQDWRSAAASTISRPRGGTAAPRSVRAWQRQAEAQERLICEAESALASQSVGTWLQWYSSWRSRGVRVNDLLDMTWVWRQRSSR